MTAAEVGPGFMDVLAPAMPDAEAADEQMDAGVNEQMLAAVAAGDAAAVASALAAGASVHATFGKCSTKGCIYIRERYTPWQYTCSCTSRRRQNIRLQQAAACMCTMK
jgi:hypothetical protein